jgi:diaminopimelate epimerase
MPLEFVKMQGLGNDFVVVDRREAGTPLPAELAVRLCDRHLGIGADGVLSIVPSDEAALAMHVTNADGSVAEMCGNGLRCVARWAVERGFLPAGGGVVGTGAGLRHAAVLPDGRMRVDMGRPELAPARIPLDAPGDRWVEQPLEVGGTSLRVTAVSMGNPHAVCFVDDDVDLRGLAGRVGPLAEVHPRFPRRTNVELARLLGPRAVDLIVWERGAGLTAACGTGACATVVAGVVTSRLAAGEDVTVRLPGGALEIRVEPGLERVWMTGPAVEVFRGEVPSSPDRFSRPTRGRGAPRTRRS